MNVKVTMEIPAEMLTDLQALLTGNPTSIQELYSEPVPVPEAPAVVAVPSIPAGNTVSGGSGKSEQSNTPGPENATAGSEAPAVVTKSMIRAKGLELTQAGKKNELEAVFKKFGAAKLRDLKEEDYAEAYRLLGEI